MYAMIAPSSNSCSPLGVRAPSSSPEPELIPEEQQQVKDSLQDAQQSAKGNATDDLTVEAGT